MIFIPLFATYKNAVKRGVVFGRTKSFSGSHEMSVRLGACKFYQIPLALQIFS